MKYIKTQLFQLYFTLVMVWKSVDRDLIDNLGPNGMSKFVGS